MTQWIFTSCVLILSVLVIRALGKDKLSARLRYALWGLVLLRLLIPGSIGESALSVRNWMREKTVTQVQTNPILILDMMEQEQNSETGNVPENPLKQNETTAQKTNVLLIVWGVGAFVVGSVILASNLRFTAQLRRSRKQMMIHVVPVYVTDAVETPCLFGMWRPSVYMPADVWADERTLRHVLAHELTHYRHKDHIWSLLRCICVTVHWYNPLVWLAAILSQNDGEQACDEGALRELGEQERTDYAKTLLELTCVGYKGVLTAATSMTGSEADLKSRVKRIAANPQMTAAAVAVTIAAVLLTGCAVFTDAKTPEIEGVWRMEMSLLGEAVAEGASAYSEYEFYDGTARRSDYVQGELRSVEKFTYTLTDQTIVLEVTNVGSEREYTWSVDGDVLKLDDGKSELHLTAVNRTSVSYLPDGCWKIAYATLSRPNQGYLQANLTDIQEVQLLNLLRNGETAETRREVADNVPYMMNLVLTDGDRVCNLTVANGMVYSENKELGYVLSNTDEIEYWIESFVWKGNEIQVSGFVPADIQDITSARLILYDRAYPANPARLDFLEELLSTAEPLGYTSGCPFDGLIELTLSDGRKVGVEPALDSCAAFLIWDVCYEYGSQFAYDEEGSYDNSELLAVFGLTPAMVEEIFLSNMQQSQGEVIGTMADIGDVVRIRKSDDMMEPKVMSDESRERMIALLAQGIGDALGEEEVTCEAVYYTIINSGQDTADGFVTLSDNGSLYMDGIRYELSNANALLQLIDMQYAIRIARDGSVIENEWYGVVGEEVYLELQGVLDGGVVTWSSSDESICTVVGDAYGATVVFKGVGEAQIVVEWQSPWNTKGYTTIVYCEALR